MESIITTNLEEITLSSQFLTLNLNDCDIEIDIKKLLKEPLNSENIYFNATEIAKCYNKKVINFLRLDGTKDYIEQIEDYFKSDLKSPLIKTVRGKYHSGTWLHKELFLEFISWCDVTIKFKFHQLIKNIIIHSNELKIDRSNTKILFKPLTDSIKDIYIPKQKSDNSKKFAYSTLSNLVNIIALGSSAKKYIKENNLDTELPLRDQLADEKLKLIEKYERDLDGYIRYANITDYDKLKERLTKW